MSKMIQLRNVPDALHRRLKARAAVAGKTLSDYVLDEVRRQAARPTLDELRDRLESRPPVKTAVTPAAAVRSERRRRDRH